MSIENLLKYLGRPATNRGFDDFLSAHAIEARPVYDPSAGVPFERIEVQESRFSMEFVGPDEYAEDFGSVRESGELIFAKLFHHLIPEDTCKAYSGGAAGCVPEFNVPGRMPCQIWSAGFRQGRERRFRSAKQR